MFILQGSNILSKKNRLCRSHVILIKFLLIISITTIIPLYSQSQERIELSFKQCYVIPENVEINDYCGKFYAYFTHNTIDNIRFEIIGGNENGYFSIDNETGVIKLAVDSVALEKHYLLIKTQDSYLYDIDTAEITVKETSKCVFINPDYSGTESGTREQPYNSWDQDIKGSFQAGAAYFQKRGTISRSPIQISGSEKGVPGNPIVLGAYGSGERPKINGTTFENIAGIHLGDWEIPTSHIEVYSFIVYNCKGVMTTPGTNNIKIFNCEANNNTDNGNFYIYNDLDETKHLNNELYNIIAHHGIDHGIKIQASGCTVVNCHTYSNDKTGFKFSLQSSGNSCSYILSENNGSNGFSLDGDFMNVENCISKSNVRNGYQLTESASNSNIKNCTGSNNEICGITFSETTSQLFIRGCEFSYNNIGILVTEGSSQIDFFQNIIKENLTYGIRVDNSATNPLVPDDIKFYYNLIYDNQGHNFYIHGCSNLDITNNTILNNNFYITDNQNNSQINLANNIVDGIRGVYTNESNLIYPDTDIFFSYSSKDFHLKYTADDAIDKGVDADLEYDFDGNVVPFGVSPDRGAFEFVFYNPSDTLPKSPTDLTGNASYYHSITLQWSDNSDNEYGFEIERSLTPQEGFTIIYSTYYDVDSYTDKNLSPETTYYYRVRAVNNIGYSNYSNEISITTPEIPPPNPPSSLRSTTIKARSAVLLWNDNSIDEDQFKLERSSTPGTGYSVIATINANQTSYTNSGLTPETTYYYRIRAYNEIGYSGYSNELSVTTIALQPPDNPPSNLTSANITKNSVTLNWTDNSSNEDGFYIYRSLTSGNGFTQVGSVSANISQFSNYGLNPSTTYYYRLRAYNEDGYSNYSNELSITTLDLQPPAAPSILSSVNITKNSITLAWTDNANNEDRFDIYRSLTSGSGYSQIGSVGTNTSQFNDSELNPNTTYYYRIRAYNEDGYSSYSNELNVTTLELQPPAAPGDLSSSNIAKTSVTLTWSDNANDEDGFYIYRSLTSGSGFIQIGSTSTNVNQFINYGLSPNTTYYYIIRAYNEDGNSDPSNELNVTTLALQPPVAPDSLTSTNITKNSVTLEWIDNSNNEEGFIVLRSLKTDVDFNEIARLGMDVATFIDYGLLPDTTYSYVVFAFNEDGPSDSSNTIEVNTLPLIPPDAPSSLQANTISYDWITLNWEDNASNELGFKIERTLDTITGYSDTINIDIPDITQFTDTGLLINTAYYYRVTAYNNDGFSDYSNILRVITLKLDPPVSPSSLSTSQVTTNTVSLEWEDNSANETGFIIERAIAPDKYFRTIHLINANTTNFTDHNLNPSTTYYYKVNAINKAGKSNNSNTAIASTLSISESKRIWDGLIAYYNFNFNSDNIIYDNSNYGEPLDLFISDTSGIVWNENNKLEIVSDNLIKSVYPATKIVNACKITNEITLEAWIKPSMFSSYNSANILTIANNADDIVATLAQEHIRGENKAFKYLIRLKTEATAANGEPNLYSEDALSYLSLHHLVYVKNSSGIERLYINGKEAANSIRPEGLKNWDNSYYLVLGNDPGLNSPWKGTFYTVAIYNTAFTEDQITTNYYAGPKDKLTNSVINYDIEISPNPSDGMVNIKITPRSENELVEKTMIQICDIMGDLKFHEIIEDPNREQIKSYNFSEFASGIYIIQVISNDHFDSERFIVK